MQTNEYLNKTIIVPAKYQGTITCTVVHVDEDILYCKDKYGNKYEFGLEDVIQVL